MPGQVHRSGEMYLKDCCLPSKEFSGRSFSNEIKCHSSMIAGSAYFSVSYRPEGISNADKP